MQNTVHKKKSEIMLWEVNAPAKKTRPKSAVGKTANLSVISTNGRPRVANRPPQRSPQAIKRRKARRRRAYFFRAMAFCVIGVCIALLVVMAGLLYQTVHTWRKQDVGQVRENPTVFWQKTDTKVAAPEISTALIDVNEYSRPGTPLGKVKSIFVHYTANPRTSAVQNRSYFANLAETHERSASAHFIIGYEGEIIQCIPLDEQAYAVRTRNEDSISIECCYLDEDGKFTQETYDSLIHMLAWLKEEYKLDRDDILRHYDCGGKLCPLYYVEHEDLWEQLLSDVEAYEAGAGEE